jgi:citrate synthase
VSDADERLGTEEVARRLGVKRETVYAYVSRGLLERHPASGPHDSRFDPEEVERLAARSRRPDRSSALEVVVETELTLLDPAGRLSYRGRDAVELARFRSFEEVVALLWDGAPPTPWDLDDERAPAIAALGEVLGPDAPDAERIAAVVATLAARDPSRDDRDPESVRRAGAGVFAGILAALGRGRPEFHSPQRGRPEYRYAERRSTAVNWPEQRSTAVGSVGQRTTAVDANAQETIAVGGHAPSHPTGASIAERLWDALADGDAKPRPEQVATLNAALILLADHELAASTFAARVAASAWAGPYRVILAGLGPLGGALHGGAGLEVEALIEVVATGTDPGATLDARLAAGPLPGFGHKVYRDRDPRADHLLERLGLVSDRGRRFPPRPERGRPYPPIAPVRTTPGEGAPVRTTARAGIPRTDGDRALVAAQAVLDAATERGLPAPNVDFALAALVKAHGLRDGSSPTIFTVARIAGIVAHALEEYEHRLRFRPRASYVGPAPPPRP